MPSPNCFSLDGKRAIVTGASRGLGEGMARGLASAGASVAVVSRGARELERVRAALGSEAAAIPFEVHPEAPFDVLVDRCEEALGGPVDIVLHAAGIQHRQPAEHFDAKEWQRVLDVNLTSPFLLSQEVGRRQLAQGRSGSHIFVGSLSSLLSIRGVIAYTASKSAIYGVVRNLSLEWSARGIRVNAIGPGYIRTQLTEALFRDEEQRRRLMQRIPAGRFGTPQDMAGAAIFLASDASAYITGQLLMVDGGWSAS
jgi:NAD(P)-dependent dehydrogenase (short-subunit alcohol dehydrogenase family)